MGSEKEEVREGVGEMSGGYECVDPSHGKPSRTLGQPQGLTSEPMPLRA